MHDQTGGCHAHILASVRVAASSRYLRINLLHPDIQMKKMKKNTQQLVDGLTMGQYAEIQGLCLQQITWIMWSVAASRYSNEKMKKPHNNLSMV
jgi:hypothetical protein